MFRERKKGGAAERYTQVKKIGGTQVAELEDWEGRDEVNDQLGAFS